MRWLLLVVLMLLPGVQAASLSNYLPANNSYFGRGNVSFYVNVTSSSLDYARLYLISEDAYINGEPWDTYTMQCSGNPYNCTKTVSFAIAGADTIEFFYFEANDSSGVNRLGNPGFFQFRLDRSPPVITFLAPLNGSYVSGNVTVRASSTDAVSGVNADAYRLSLDNSTWSSMPSGTGYFNSSAYSNNQTLTIYVRASDILNNTGTSAINATVDNEKPRISVTSHSAGATVRGTVSFVINALDSFSGADRGKLSISGSESTMTCTGTRNATCNVTVNTALFPDNAYNVTFSVNDTAGNVNSTNFSLTINNNMPSVTLSPEGYVTGTASISASLSNPGSIINGVHLSIERSGYGNNVTMSCNSQFTSCSYSFNTVTAGDGAYTLTANASNILDQPATDTVAVTADNTDPVVAITGPNSAVSSTFTISATVNDTNYDRTRVSYTVSGSGTTMSCVVASSNSILCEANYDPSGLSNGEYSLSVTATDAAGNSGSASKTITVSKSGSVNSDSGSSSGNSNAPGLWYSENDGRNGSANGSGSSGNFTPADCGNNVCSLSETCSNCAADCGTCRDEDIPGNGGGNGNSVFDIFGSGGGSASDIIASNPVIIAILGAVLVAAGVAIKVLRKKPRGIKPENPKKIRKEKEKPQPFIFGPK